MHPPSFLNATTRPFFPQISGAIIAPVAVLFMAYALYMYKKRTIQIMRRETVRGGADRELGQDRKEGQVRKEGQARGLQLLERGLRLKNALGWFLARDDCSV